MMNIVDVLPSSFPVSDTRPSQSIAYLDHVSTVPTYVDSRPPSKDTRTPPLVEQTIQQSPPSPQSTRGKESLTNGAHLHGQQSPQSAVAGKKRSANGEIKEEATVSPEMPKLTYTNHGHSRTKSNVSSAGNTAMLELSQQLRTRLTYAMIKVQNGWQNRSLDEVESLASASPRSTTFNHYSDNKHLLSPRTVIAAQLVRQDSGSSTDSSHSQTLQTRHNPIEMSPPTTGKGLAPPANIVARSPQQRRRPTPNMQLQTGQLPWSSRPAVKHRTPSQNAAMEADAVETLLFMASPNHSGNHSSQFSPVKSAPSLHQYPPQTSPLRNTFFVPSSPKRVAFAANGLGYAPDKNAILASMIEKLDDDGDADLDEALKVLERHHAGKVTA